MERLIVIDGGIVYELDDRGYPHFVCLERTFQKGPSLTCRRIIIRSSIHNPDACLVYVQTHTNLCEHVGYVFIKNNKMPKVLALTGRTENIKIEEGSPLYDALKACLKSEPTLAEEICKAPDDSEESYW